MPLSPRGAARSDAAVAAADKVEYILFEYSSSVSRQISARGGIWISLRCLSIIGICTLYGGRSYAVHLLPVRCPLSLSNHILCISSPSQPI